MTASLDRYFERIGYTGTPRADLPTLTALHRLHLQAIAYENLDIHLGVATSGEAAAAFEKLVLRARGGWCYEMNGLLSWALQAIGFRVTPVAAGASREQRGERMLGNHLAMLVHLDHDYLADVGFAEGILEPLPLREGSYRQGALQYRLQRIEHGYWRFVNHERAAVTSFDFKTERADARLLASQCDWLRSAPESPFVNHAVCFIFDDAGISMLREQTFRRIDRRGMIEWVITGPDEYQTLLAHVFDLHLTSEQVQTVWSGIVRRVGLRAAALPHEPADAPTG